MSLLEHIESTTETSRHSTRHHLREMLREALYAKLPSEKIAMLISTDRSLAYREVASVLELLLRTGEFERLALQDGAMLRQEVLDMVLGFGPLEGLLDDPSVTEIMVNGPDSVFYEREGRLYASEVTFSDEQQVRMVIDRIVGPLGRRVDEQSPLVSARMPKGHRVNIIIPPLAIDGPVITIRKFREEMYTLTELTRLKTLTAQIAQLLSWAVLMRKNIAVSGGTGSGKTTLLNALSAEIPLTDRIITIEDAAELRFHKHPHVVRLEARARNAEGTGEVNIRDLVVNALRMRPDRIVVGECRGAEALDMLQAMNTGHDGSLTTLHANSPAEVVTRLVMMARYGMDLPVEVIEEQIASALDIIVQLDRHVDGTRRITQVALCDGDRSGVVLQTVVSWDRALQQYQWKNVPTWMEDPSLSDLIAHEEVSLWKESLTPCRR